MAGGKKARENWFRLRDTVVGTLRSLGFETTTGVPAGKGRFGKERKIHVVATDCRSEKTLGIECRTQSVRGTTDEKLPLFIEDIKSWPIYGILVFDGCGWSDEAQSYLQSEERAVALEDLDDLLNSFFQLEPARRV